MTMERDFVTKDTFYKEDAFDTPEIEATYKETRGLQYPLIYLTFETGEMHILRLINSFTLEVRDVCEDRGYYLYVELEGHLQMAGILPYKSLRSFLNSKVLKDIPKYIILENGTKYTSDLMYALCLAEC